MANNLQGRGTGEPTAFASRRLSRHDNITPRQTLIFLAHLLGRVKEEVNGHRCALDAVIQPI